MAAVDKDVRLDVRQLVQRGFDHYERGRLHDALSDWETALRLDPRNHQVRRLVEFAHQREIEIESGQHPPASRRDTVESPIPQFLAALTERRSERIHLPTDDRKSSSAVRETIEDRETPQHDWTLMAAQMTSGAAGHKRQDERQDDSHDATSAPDTLEDLHVQADDVRASTTELIGECRAALNENRAGPASLAGELALQLAERAPPPGLDDLIAPSLALFERAFRAFMGNPHACPIRAIATETIAGHGLDQRAAFLMSRMDGLTSIADLIDSSGMSHFDAVRVMASLKRAKAIDILPPM
jgi:hypothetical protein